MISSYPLHHKTPRTPRRCSALTQEILTWHLVIEMFTLPQKDFSAPTTCLGPTCLQDLGSSHGDDLEGECSRKLDQKLPELPGVGDSAMLSPDTSYLSSRGRMIKWFWDSAEEGYRTYHMDEYDENKNPSGIINLGVSENKLCFDLLSWRLSQSDMQRVEPSLLQYADWRGHLFLREEVAKFLSFYCKSPAPLRPENVVVLNGGASLFSALATVLCEAGDWINQVYLPENHARLKAAHTYVSEELRALGIPFLSRGAGFFIWVDLRKGCRGSGRCLQANPKWLKTLLPLRARSQVTNAGELLIASWPEGPAATVDLGRSGAAEDRLWMCHSPGRCLTWLCTQRTVSCLLL
ncbi:1-aminocyclopropane-1-carboxylate synthase-like protein 1 isoform X22 [Macaca fascicularis]|uniref:1-aminocyclopropane-1-carboxylate synthase-like protein 1 isoform X22 n=1 Tax=Macaca fascicularis TaxID=9541 RepID=UPI003D15B00F